MNPIFFFLRKPKHFQWILIVHGMRRGNNITPTECSQHSSKRHQGNGVYQRTANGTGKLGLNVSIFCITITKSCNSNSPKNRPRCIIKVLTQPQFIITSQCHRTAYTMRSKKELKMGGQRM